MQHRQILLDRIINQQQNRESSSNSGARPIDEWAIHMRLAQQQQQNQSQNQSQLSRFMRENQQPSTDDNDDNDSITAQFGDFQEERPPRPGPIGNV